MINREQIKQNLRHFALIGFFAAVAMMPSFYFGLTSSNDLAHHFQLAHIVKEALATGEIYPSWAGEANGGYGDVTIRFYPPLSYYFLSAVFIIVGDWYYAGLITFFLIFYLSGIGIFLWAKEEFSVNQSLAAAAIYIFAPFHLNEIYNNFLFAEFTAGAILPFCFLFITRACQKGRLQDYLGLSISYCLLILTHLPLTVIGSLAFAIYALVLLRRSEILKTLVKLAASVIFAFAGSAFYWVRMITELKWVNLSNKSFYTGTFDYRANFLLNPQNILNFHTDELCLWLAELMFLTMILISVPSVYFLIRERKTASKFQLAAAIVFFISVFMTSQFSQFVWDNVSFLQKVQFPWRWLGIVALSGALFSSGGILRAARAMEQKKNILLTFGLGFIISIFVFSAAFIIKQAVYLPRVEFNKQIANIEGRLFHEFWWIIEAKPEALSVKEKLLIQNRETEIINWSNNDREFVVFSGEKSLLRVAIFYYPYWRATVNGNSAEIERADDGSILIPLPSENSRIRLYFAEPIFVRLANYISIFCWMFFFSGSAFLIFKPRRFRE